MFIRTYSFGLSSKLISLLTVGVATLGVGCEGSQGSSDPSPNKRFVGQFAAQITVTVDQELPVIGLTRSVTQSSKLFTVREGENGLTLEEKVCRIEMSSEGPAKPSMGKELIARFPTVVSPLNVTREADGWRWRREATGIVLGAQLEDVVSDALPESAEDSRLVDLDEDGLPGITIPIKGVVDGSLHAVLRYVDELSGYVSDDAPSGWSGQTKDFTEQRVLGASHEFLITQIPATQLDDPSLNQVQVFPIDVSGDAGCDEALATIETELGIPVKEPTTDTEPRPDAPFGVMCDGSPATVYDEQLLERPDCGEDEATPFEVSPKRIELEPTIESYYEDERCGPLSDSLTQREILTCAESEFWHGFSDGRYVHRQASLDYINEAFELLETAGFDPELNVEIARLYMLRAMVVMALGLENGMPEYMIESDKYITPDFDRVEELDPGNFVAFAFKLTLEMTIAGIEGDFELAERLAYEALDAGLSLGDPEVVDHPKVGAILGLSGTLMTWPLASEVPQATLEALEMIGCPDDVEFCVQNTTHAPFARVGLEYHKAEYFARVNLPDRYRAQLEVVTTQPGYEIWPWRDLVELQREEPERLLNKYLSYGEEEFAQSYATGNNACVICHGR